MREKEITHHDDDHTHHEASSLLNNGLINESGTTHQKAENTWFIYAITALAAIGGFLFGYDTGVVSGAILFIKDEFHMSSFEVEAFVSVALLGAIVGSLAGGPSADKWGRRPVISVASILFIMGSLVLGVAFNLEMLIAGRFVVGLGIGIASNITPVYVAEISPAESRGKLVTIINLCITTGQFISYLVDSALANVHDGWRFMLGLAAVPALLQLIGMIFIVPESPRWFVAHSRREDARKILQKIRGAKNDISVEMREIEQSLSHEDGSWKELFDPALRPALLLGIALQAFQQFCGINTAMYYSATILNMAGYKDKTTAIWFSDAVALANAIFTIVALFLIDRLGRRKLLLTSMVGATLGLVCLGLSFQLNDKLPQYTGYMALCSLVLYVAFFAIGLGPIPWCVTSEIYPNRVRGLANSVSTTTNWTSNLIVSMTFLSYIKLVGTPSAFWTYAGFGVVGFIIFFFKLPETKGKTIEEIQEQFRK